MKIIYSMDEINQNSACSLALGAFDGLHRGHMEVIGRGMKGMEKGWEASVFTFKASPGGKSWVCTPEDKERLLEGMGINRLYLMEFSQVRDMEAQPFFREVLLKGCGAKRLCCGEDFRFGKGAKGDVELLRSLCRETGTELIVVPPVLEGEEKVSSSRIREAVENGDIPMANNLLGRPFGFSLKVIHGNHIGTGLGAPTINQALPENFVLPKFGVYASLAEVGGRLYYGVTNIGVKPTVGSDKVLAETWMPEFSGDLYGKLVRLLLLEFIRPEKKFSSLEELKEEIMKNAMQAKEIVNGYNGFAG